MQITLFGSLRRMLSAVCLASLAGCASHGLENPVAPPDIPRYQSPRIDITASGNSRVVYVDSNTGRISAASRYALDTIISTTRENYSTPVHLVFISDLPQSALTIVTQAGRDDGVSASRIRYINRAASVPPIWSHHRRYTPVEVLAVTYQAIPPDCQNGANAMTMLQQVNENSTNFACSMVNNFIVQIQDPADLLRGEGGGKTDSLLTDTAIQRLEQGKQQALLVGSFAVGG